MGVPIAINGRELNVNDMAVEPGAEYLVTVGKTASSVKVERTDLKAENERLRRRYGECQNELTQTMCDYGAALDDIVKLKADNAKLRELLLDCWDFSHLMHGSMASRYLELGLIGKDEARELGIEMD